jgi:phosphoribosyl-ATP pyrophosphohydrolase/phosphoribosyl-AMP cyclohydrolase
MLKKEYDDSNPLKVFEREYNTILDRKANPKEGSYTNYLFDKGIDKILKKVGEECTEIIIAAKNPNPEEIKYLDDPDPLNMLKDTGRTRFLSY